MTPEERAKEAVLSILAPIDKAGVYIETPYRAFMAERIAQAIRQAENEAIERAAMKSDRVAAHHRGWAVTYPETAKERRRWAHDFEIVASDIRSLATKDP